MLKKSGVLCGSIIIVCSMFVWAETRSVDLTSVMPRQDVLRVKKGVIGEDYRKRDKQNIPANTLMVEEQLNIGTSYDSKNFPIDVRVSTSSVAGIRIRNEDATSNAMLTAVNDEWDSIGIGKYGSSQGTDYGIESGDGYIFNQSGTFRIVQSTISALSISDRGNVGIGTTDPDERLHVNGGVRIAERLAVGEDTDPRGDNSLAMGSETRASGDNSLAMGDNTATTARNAVAMGKETEARSFQAVAMGKETEATAIEAVAMGYKTHADGEQSVAMGVNTLAEGFHSVAMGDSTTASSINAVAMGSETTASGLDSVAMGKDTEASGEHSLAMGEFTVASGIRAVAMGRDTEASGGNAVAMGSNTTASAGNAVAMGDETTASGLNSLAMGSFNTEASGYNSVAIGTNLIVSGDNSVGIRLDDGIQKELESNNTLSIMGGNVRISGGNFYAGEPEVRGTLGNPVVRANIHINNGRIYRAASSKRYKKNIRPLEDKFSEILNAIPKLFEYKNEGGKGLGFIAEDLEELGLTNLVIFDKEGRPEDVNYDGIICYQNEVIKNQHDMIFNLKAEVKELRETVSSIENRLE